MKRPEQQILPIARKEDLVTRQLPGELLIYDLQRHKAFCLNQSAAIVWRSCNGKRTLADLTEELQRHSESPIDEQVVWLALDQLQKSNLLQMRFSPSLKLRISRRGLIRAGMATTIAVPVITMIVAPIAASAASTITNAICKKRKPTDPGGCGGARCSNAPGNCINISGNCACG
jgi:Coenzyme PQQ synthesis protein D (PqqD)